MKSSVFEQAAIEASSGVKDIDAEIDRLDAKRQSLEAGKEVLQSLMHQLLAALPVIADTFPADDANLAAASTPEPPAAEEPLVAEHLSEHQSFSSQNEESPAGYDLEAASDAPTADQPSFASLLSQAKPYSLRNEGWPASSPVPQASLRELL